MPSLARYLTGIPLCLLLIGLSGCHQQPRAELQKPHPQSITLETVDKPKFGSFDLRKRHGLGGWQGKSGPSRQELLKQMSPAKSPASVNDVETGEPR